MNLIPSPLISSESYQGLNEAYISKNRSGTSINLAGDFALSLDGSRSQYLKSNASARDLKVALEALDTVGTVDVERYDGDEQVIDIKKIEVVWVHYCRQITF